MAIEGTIQPAINFAELGTAGIYAGLGAVGGFATSLIGWAKSTDVFDKWKFTKTVVLLTVFGAAAGLMSNDWKTALIAPLTPAFLQAVNSTATAIKAAA